MNQQPRSISTTLLTRVKAKDNDAWARLDRLFRGEIECWFAKSWQIDEQRSSELAQNVLTRVLVAVDRFQRGPQGTFRGWLWTIARNEAMDHYRQMKRHDAAVGGTDMQLRLAGIPAEPPRLEPADEDRWFASLCEALSPSFSSTNLVILREGILAGRSSVDLASELGMTAAAVRKQKHDIRRRLRRDWEELLGEWPSTLRAEERPDDT